MIGMRRLRCGPNYLWTGENPLYNEKYTRQFNLWVAFYLLPWAE